MNKNTYDCDTTVAAYKATFIAYNAAKAAADAKYIITQNAAYAIYEASKAAAAATCSIDKAAATAIYNKSCENIYLQAHPQNKENLI